MDRTRISSKGQIVIPKQIRDRHRWRPGTELQAAAERSADRSSETRQERLPLIVVDTNIVVRFAVNMFAQHCGDFVFESLISYHLRPRIWPICFWHANRGFVRAFSVPCSNNGLIGLKDDKGRRRIGVFETVFRRSTSS